jgi:hypothetical protein
LAETHAAAIKHTVIAVKKTIGKMKKYRQLKIVMARKHKASVQAVPRMSAKVSAGSPPSCHANTAASRRNTVTKSPAPTNKSQ